MNRGKSVFGLLILLALSVALPSAIYCAPPVLLKSVDVSVSVDYETNSGLYTYNYTVGNPAGNGDAIYAFNVNITKPENAKSLNSEGLVIQTKKFSYGDIKTASFDSELRSMRSIMKVEVIPVGIEVPSDWSGGFSTMGMASWSGSEEKMIAPGSYKEGLILDSYGPPSITEFKVEPSYIVSDEDILNSGVTKEEYLNNVYKYLSEFNDSIAFKGKTLGPTAPPAELDPAAFLKGIIDMKHEAYALGWITNEGIEKSLDAKLDSALKKLQGGQTNAAANVLKAFINEVEAQGCASYEDCPEGKHLKPEAYALLKYNAQYLIDNLK